MSTLDNAPKTMDLAFVMKLLENLDAKELTPKFSIKTKEYTIDFNKVITSLFNNTLDLVGFTKVFYEACLKEPLKACVVFKATTVEPISGKDWPFTWGEVKKAQKELVNALKVFGLKMLTEVLLPVRSGMTGDRQKKGAPKIKKVARDPDFRPKLHSRDSSRCPITKVISDTAPGDPVGDKGALEGAHIIPHHLAAENKLDMRKTIEIFGGANILKDLPKKVDDVSNGILIDLNCHGTFDKLQWSIEAIYVAATNSYIYKIRRTRNDKKVHAGTSSIHLSDGTEITFGNKPGLAPPNPNYCNLHLAISRVVQAAGLADIFDVLVDEDDEFDGSVPSTDTLADKKRKAEEIALEEELEEETYKKMKHQIEVLVA